MNAGLTIKVVDRDSDYLGIEIRAANDRFSGTTRIYAGLDELSGFANLIAGFPANTHDEREYEFGRRGQSFAGGFCRLHFRCLDNIGHAAIAVDLEDDFLRCPPGSARFSFKIEPAALDSFVIGLREAEHTRFGEAILPLAF